MPTLTTKNIPLGSVSVTIMGVQRMWRELNVLVAEQGEIELARLVKSSEQTQENFEAYREDIRQNVFRILGTVEFDNDEVVHDVDPDIVKFDSEGPRIRLIYLSNITPYQQRVGVKPDHAFEVVIDLKNPPLLDATSVLSEPTSNGTRLSISGTRAGWQAGVEAVVRRNIARRRPVRTWLHGSFVYDMFLFVVGLPLAFYACWALGPVINNLLSETSSVVIGAAYLYVGFTAIWGYRIMFSYAKWAFPLAEITDQSGSPSHHRAIWWSLIVAIFTKPFWSIAGDVIKKIFGLA